MLQREEGAAGSRAGTPRLMAYGAPAAVALEGRRGG